MKKLAIVIALLLILTICFCACSGEQLAMDLAEKVIEKEGLHPNKNNNEDKKEEQAGGETEGDGEQGGEDGEDDGGEYIPKTIDDSTFYDEVTPSLTEEQFNAALDYNTNFREFTMYQVITIQVPGGDTVSRGTSKRKFVFNETAFMVYNFEEGEYVPGEYYLIKDGYFYSYYLGYPDDSEERIWMEENDPSETEETNILLYIPTVLSNLIFPGSDLTYDDFRYNEGADLYTTNKYSYTQGSANILLHLSFKEGKLTWIEEVRTMVFEDYNAVNEILYNEEELTIQYGHQDIDIPTELAELLP